MKTPLAIAFCGFAVVVNSGARADQASLQSLIAQHAAQNNIPEILVHRVVRRESNYNPGAVGRGGALGLMQIKYATARGMGYAGSPAGLLDANTNLTYAVRYLAGAYRVADGNQDRAVSYFANGYYYVAKRRGMTGDRSAQARTAAPVEAAALPQPAPAPQSAALSWGDLR
jgi:soluble lytic murein transglycosylase-like protein